MPKERFLSSCPEYHEKSVRDAFRRLPRKLDFNNGQNSKSSTSFSEIPIVIRGAYPDGLGDFMNTLKLAKAMQKHFPDKRCVIYFPSDNSYPKEYLPDEDNETQKLYAVLGRVCKSFDSSNDENVIDGIPVIRRPSNTILEELKHQTVAINMHFLHGSYGLGGGLGNDFLSGSRINLYFSEYDYEDMVGYPCDMIPKFTYQINDRLHLFIPTGFSPDSAFQNFLDVIQEIRKQKK
jgi:hypothetical protein